MEYKPIELRPIFVPTSKIAKGKLELWVDIMTPEQARKNPPENIEPPQPERWEVRAIVWNVENVLFNFEGGETVDLFVTGKLGDHKHQLTDTHWSSPDGHGEFNWRFIWDVIIPSRKENRLLLQVWDKNMVHTNEAIAECTINLTQFFKNAYKNKNNVYIVKQLVDMTLPGKGGLTQGSIELEVEIVPQAYALANPVGKGRDGLPDVNRPPPPWDMVANAGKLGNWLQKNVTGPMKKKLIIGAVILAIVLILALIIWIAL